MIYSKWRPDSGGYDYFDAASEKRGLGDDLPTPRLTAIGGLGVASTSAGRPMPAGARFVGSGAIARGLIAPLDRRGLSLSGINLSFGGVTTFVLGTVLGVWLCRKKVL